MNTWREKLIQAVSDDQGRERYAQSLRDVQNLTGCKVTVGQINMSPIKSLGLLSLEEAVCSPVGLMTPGEEFFDREAMLGRRVSGKLWDFERFSQREEPCLSLARPIWHPNESNFLEYHAEGMSSLELDVDDFQPDRNTHERATVRLTSNNDTSVVLVDDGHITQWVREFLMKHQRMERDVQDIHVLFGPQKVRNVEKRHACGTNAFTNLSDGGQLLITSAITFDWFNGILKERGSLVVPMEAFRPNIVLYGLPANGEDIISGITSEDNRSFLFGGHCVRCSVTTVDPATGNKRIDNQPLSGLKKYRPARPPENSGVTFGINCVQAGTKHWTLRKGDEFTVIGEK